MNFHVLTLFPDMIMQGLSESIIGKAREKGSIMVEAVNIRDYTEDKHKKVDDYPYGGGAGLLMQAQPVCDAHAEVLRRIGKTGVRTIYLTPQGETFNQRMAEELAREEDLIFLCGHYEGIDERALEEVVTDYVSLGDFVLTGGELPAMVMIDSIARLVPGVLHNDDSASDESFSGYLLEYPQYSRPEVFQGKKVPEVLLSGDHKKIRIWREEAAKERTRIRRPDMYAEYERLMDCRSILIKRGKLHHIMMTESILRGNAKLLFHGEEGTLLQDKKSGLYMISVKDREAGKKILDCVFGNDICSTEMAVREGLTHRQMSVSFVSHQEFMNDLLAERFGLKISGEQIPVVFTRKESLPVKWKDIRQLEEVHLQNISTWHTLTDEAYIRGLIRKGAVFGIFEEDKLVGLMGECQEGDLGLLEILPGYRNKGLAAALEAFLINRTLKKGYTPFGMVAADNEAALKLQEKLGLYPAKKKIWRLTK
ncbi:MAG: tRNA (guanosine(37)-N1)-methyltransferase TrmD [Lachnospiraceae bacterium]